MGKYNWTTCSKVIKAEVKTVQMELQRLLGQQLSGIYLHGSLALGGFSPSRSDIDMIVATEQRMDVEVKRAIIELLLRVSKMPSPLDIYFLAERDMFPFRHPLPYDLHYSEEQREQYQQELRDGSWKRWNESSQHDPVLTIALTVLHKCGICLSGKSIAEAFPVVPEQDFRDELIKNIQTAEEHRRENPISFVLNACRVLAYLHDGAILSKDDGGEWGLAHLPEQYHALIEQSLALYRGERPGRPVGRTALDDFAAHMHEAVQS